ncbi:MAG: hypothetical protein AB7F66_14650 [Bacteriovoracia bacterium]
MSFELAWKKGDGQNIEVSIFESHLQHCVRTAMLTKDKKQIEAKIAELSELLSRRTSL